MKRTTLAKLALLAMLVVSGLILYGLDPDPTPGPTPAVPYPAAQAQVENAVLQAVESALQENKEPIFELFETHVEGVTFSQDGQWASAWIVPIDPDSGQIVPTEPGLVLVQRRSNAPAAPSDDTSAQASTATWRAILPSQPEWVAAIRSAPSDLVSPERKAEWLIMADARPQGLAAALQGYRLPWPGGETMRLTQSVGHDRYTPSGSAHFSFDFAKPGYPSGMFNLHAARAGVVSRVRWTQTNGDAASPGNYIVLEDKSTNTISYQLYLHLAKDSIPEALRTVGTLVEQGQFLGVADDTGISSGNHLHFMVHTSPTSYWGTAVDIVFEDVSINGGRPRITSDKSYCKASDVCDSFQTDYVSQNYYNADILAPAGNLSNPISGEIMALPTLPINGWALDDESGLANVQIIAQAGGAWKPIGPIFDQTQFAFNWDWCQSNVPDGPVSLALEISDQAGNRTPGLPGLTHVVKNYTCPARNLSCTPTSNQVALYTAPDFNGACAVFAAGSYPSPDALSELGDNNIQSILVGASAQATLFSDSGQSGRAETLQGNDANLADNRVGSLNLSSLLVQARGAAPGTPRPQYPASGAVLPATLHPVFSWSDAGGGVEFQVRLLQSSVTLQTSPWLAESAWRPAAIAPGSYTWQVRARSGSSESAWSNAWAFSLQSDSTSLPVPLSVPLSSDFEAAAPNWVASPGWRLTPGRNHTPDGAQSWQYLPADDSYNTGSANAGALTSPPIQLPAGSAYVLRFWYTYDTEGPQTHWDQRRVQISVDGSAFSDLLLLSGDPPNVWLQSPPLSLAAFAGQSVRLRFDFATLDAVNNSASGWAIDDLSIANESLPTCSDSDNSPAQAGAIAYDANLSGEICPAGDVDYFTFQGAAGDVIGARIEAAMLGSPLDSYLTLLDGDGRSVLAENDDQMLYQRPDSWSSYRLTRSGTYYLKVAAWDHPSAGSALHRYNIRLVKDNIKPLGLWVAPTPGGVITSGPSWTQISAGDVGSGISHVVFMWHSADWQNTPWLPLGDDWDGSDGWQAPLDEDTYRQRLGGALHVQIYDWAGNMTSLVLWNLRQPALYLPLTMTGR